MLGLKELQIVGLLMNLFDKVYVHLLPAGNVGLLPLRFPHPGVTTLSADCSCQFGVKSDPTAWILPVCSWDEHACLPHAAKEGLTIVQEPPRWHLLQCTSVREDC